MPRTADERRGGIMTTDESATSTASFRDLFDSASDHRRFRAVYSSTTLARNASSILSRCSCLPTELGAHPPVFTLSTNTPNASYSPLVTAVTSLSTSSSIGCLSAPVHPSSLIACSLVFFRKGNATPFWSDIPGRPKTQRWHAMRNKGDEETGLGGSKLVLLEEENVDWERVWSRSVAGDALPSSLKDLRCVPIPPRVVWEFFSLRQTGVHTIITLTDNAPQGLN
jgi:hypothetical protein